MTAAASSSAQSPMKLGDNKWLVTAYTRKQKTAAVEALYAEMDELKAPVAKLTEDNTDPTAAVAELDAAMAKATKLRKE